jgi:hypothetical protein
MDSVEHDPQQNPRRSSLIKTVDRKMSQVAAFSPLLARWELERHHPDKLVAPGAFDFECALLFVDISGFTALCTKLDIDVLQRHINTYFGELIDVVSKHDGDVLRFVGDALFCAWSLPCGAEDEGTLALATLAACRCALELHQKCSSYLIPEANEHLSMCAPSPPPPSPPPPSPISYIGSLPAPRPGPPGIAWPPSNLPLLIMDSDASRFAACVLSDTRALALGRPRVFAWGTTTDGSS